MGLRKNNSSVFSFPMVDIHLRKLQWVYFLRHAGVKGNDRADRLGGKTNPHNCFSEDLKCWGASNTTCQHKAKDFIPSIAWRRWHQSDEDWNCFTGNVGETSERAHMDFSETIDTILNWTGHQEILVHNCHVVRGTRLKKTRVAFRLAVTLVHVFCVEFRYSWLTQVGL